MGESFLEEEKIIGSFLTASPVFAYLTLPKQLMYDESPPQWKNVLELQGEEFDTLADVILKRTHVVFN